MPSINTFIIVNTTFTAIGYLYYLIFLYTSYPYHFLYISTFLKNSCMLLLIHYFSIKHLHVNNTTVMIQSKDIYNCLLITSMDVVSILICKKTQHTTLLEVVYFIPYSFLFEIVFDLFHYITHRSLHSRYLYKYVHKRHHEYHDDTTILATFHQDPIDLMITNLLPMYITSYLLPFTTLQYFIFLLHKTFIEVSGHLGKDMRTSCFSQFVWLPKYFHIELYSIDHYYHHTKRSCNYSKRFKLWDIAFGTFYKKYCIDIE